MVPQDFGIRLDCPLSAHHPVPSPVSPRKCLFVCLLVFVYLVARQKQTELLLSVDSHKQTAQHTLVTHLAKINTFLHDHKNHEVSFERSQIPHQILFKMTRFKSMQQEVPRAL